MSLPQDFPKRRVAVLVSGGGRSLENLSECIAAGSLNASIGLVLSDRSSAGALARAERLGLEQRVVSWKDHRTANPASAVESFSSAIFDQIEEQDCDLVVLAGFLRLLLVPPHWRGRVLNIHPSLLPAFGGPGFYGEHVHRSVIERGVQFSGCTVHFVDDRYDEGPIILQRCIEVTPGENADQLAARVFEEEKLALPEAIRRVLDRESTANCARGKVPGSSRT
ncbi:MAG: phosphoribosylglycinamide formyltransferase-1 [Planctomycetota bacterium]|jgi:phosphoribosylglycinamide formyltransferase-1